MIDFSIINLFSQVLMNYVFIRYIHLTFTNIIKDISVTFFYIVLIIFVAILYQIIAHKFLGNSLGKELLQLQYYMTNGGKVDRNTLLRREMMKYYLFYATFGIYGLYSYYKILRNSEYLPYHSAKTDTYVGRKIYVPRIKIK